MMAFKTPARCNNPMKPVLDSSLSTHFLQPKVVPDPNLKWIGIRSKVPWQMTRLRIEANGAQEMSVFCQQRATHTWPDSDGA